MKVDWKAVVAQVKKRLWGPAGSVLLHVVAVVILLNIGIGSNVEMSAPVEAVVMDTKAEKLETEPEVEKEIKKEIEKLPDPVDMPEHEIRNDATYSATEEISDIPNPGEGRGLGTGTGTGVGDGDQAGLQISGAKSPLVMKGLYGSRSSGGRGKALSKYGGGGATEGAVLRALRWLKKNQNSNGSWDGKSGGSSGSAPPDAMTGWALLCYLAHGETPASEEFGPTVEKAIKYLMGSRDAAGGWPRAYQHAIATYAICEAYGMTKIPALKEAGYKGVDIIIRGQTKIGGFRYNLVTTDEGNDTSTAGWCAQALKAAKLAGVEHPDLENAIKQTIKGLKANASPTGGFGYSGPRRRGLTGTGVLCMQLLGAAKEPEVRLGLDWLNCATCEWAKPWLGYTLYYWYYATQAKFHAGGDIWNTWNKLFSPEIVKNQIVLKEAIAGPGGTMYDIGYWEAPGKGEAAHGLVYNTALCCLMLEVYYRYLPTYKKPEQEDEAGAAAAGPAAGTGVNIEVK